MLSSITGNRPIRTSVPQNLPNPMPKPSRTVVVLAMPGFQLLDVAGPLDVFAEANRGSGRTQYQTRVHALTKGPLVSSAGVRLMPDGVLGDAAPADTFLVAGAPDAPDTLLPARSIDALAAHAKAARRFGSVCTGAFLLAQTGLLARRRITTHWAHADAFASRFPDVVVDVDAIHVADGKLRTAAGVTAGLDLALSLVEEDLGPDTAHEVASQLVMYFRRPGGQAPFSKAGTARVAGRAALQELQRYVLAHPELPHTVASLADRLHLSPRHFARMFTDEVGKAPGAWLADVRLAAARLMLDANRTPKQVAAACGFADPDSFSRAFSRSFGLSPAQYRRLHAGS
ncbi:Transcriptional regulator GlxA family, contains an amidase domain and an AraC-type DNA-binding HTH domain [Luteibacter sp. UNC138MFCol5.1]|nr:Transcriptional regulator GlxA family, contains an amidase domain and an AraC-type DNA-binding HTH domain [Luteibacter sp. UNC138MFCol5.1]